MSVAIKKGGGHRVGWDASGAHGEGDEPNDGEPPHDLAGATAAERKAGNPKQSNALRSAGAYFFV